MHTPRSIAGVTHHFNKTWISTLWSEDERVSLVHRYHKAWHEWSCKRVDGVAAIINKMQESYLKLNGYITRSNEISIATTLSDTMQEKIDLTSYVWGRLLWGYLRKQWLDKIREETGLKPNKWTLHCHGNHTKKEEAVGKYML